MILPIVAYGNPVLKRVADEITSDYPDLSELIENMWETMYAAHGVGLAAPQIGLSIRLFVIDASLFVDEEEMDQEEIDTLKDLKKVFVNPIIEEEQGELWSFNEGCLSIPDVREDVSRKEEIVVSYVDENFTPQQLKLNGLAARVVQHEYDHIQGVLFTDHLSPLKKRLIKKRLTSISKGSVSVEYRMKFPKKSKR
ncbi:peptide deformylase [Flavobacteriaceae bacterium]|jgi:peptide deformylase|nr:peptide deformylase [Flavobacteriaceae bacterium]MDC0916862.1 peptide deformylase [Flavobacteriaceae bacterium]MDC3330025.1 peptide deformylase [Flavobacteriaceae bacterium]